MASNFFHIVGTDTEVGKSYITHQLLHILNKKNKAIPLKPIHSDWPNGEKLGEDLAIHKQFIQNQEISNLCCYHFDEPCSPNYAAHLEGAQIKIDALDLFMEKAKSIPADTLLIEGIGGVCCPLGDQITYLDFIKRHKYPTIVVGRVGLGGLNHMIMTIKLLNSENIPIKAVVLNCEKEFENNDPIYSSVIWELKQQIQCDIIGPIPRDNDKLCRELLGKIDFTQSC
jgi:dethiobiotin synthetase